MLTNGMRETFQREVKLSELESVVLARLLDFFYTGVCTVQDVGEALELARAADFFQCDVLAATCMQLACANVGPESCVAVLTAAKNGLFAGSRGTALVAMKAMKKRALVVLRRDFEVVVLTDTLHYLDLKTLEAGLKNRALNVISEGRVMKTALRWLQQNVRRYNGNGDDSDVQEMVAVVHRVFSCVHVSGFSGTILLEWCHVLCDTLTSLGYTVANVRKATAAVMEMVDAQRMSGEHPRLQYHAPHNHCNIDVTRLRYVDDMVKPGRTNLAKQSVAVMDDVLVLAYRRPEGRIEVRNTDTFAQVALLEGHRGPLAAVEFLFPHCGATSGPLRLVSSVALRNGAMRVWNMEDFTCEREVALGNEPVTYLCAMVESGSDTALLVSGHWDGSVRVWNTETWKVVRTLNAGRAETADDSDNETRYVTTICREDSEWLAWGTRDSVVQVWNIGGAVAGWACVHTVQLGRNPGFMLLYAGFLWCDMYMAPKCISLSTWTCQELPELGDTVTLLAACAGGHLLSVRMGNEIDTLLDTWALEVVQGRVHLTRQGDSEVVHGGGNMFGCVAQGRHVFVPTGCNMNSIHIFTDVVEEEEEEEEVEEEEEEEE